MYIIFKNSFCRVNLRGHTFSLPIYQTDAGVSYLCGAYENNFANHTSSLKVNLTDIPK